MTRVVGVVATLLCLLLAIPAAAVNVVPPGWNERAGSGSLNGLSDDAIINDSQVGSARSVSTAVMPDGRPVVAYRQSNPLNQLEIVVRRLSANASTWEQLGGALNVPSSAGVFDPLVRISADGDIFVAWRQQVSVLNALYLLTWNGATWVPLQGSDPDGRVTGDTVPNTINAFSLAVTPDGRPILAFQTASATPFDPDVNDPQIVFEQIYVIRWDGTSWPFLGGGPVDGGGASSAMTFGFPLGAPTDVAFHQAIAPSVVSDPNGDPIVAFFYVSSFDLPAPAQFQGNRDDLYVVRWDGTHFIPLGPAVPAPGSDESLGAPGGVSHSNAFATSAGGFGPPGASAPPTIALDPMTQHVLVAWGEGAGTGDAFGLSFTWIRSSEFNGTEWTELGPPAVSDFMGTTANTLPYIEYYDAGVPVLVWTHTTSGFNPSIYARQFNFNSSQWIEMGGGSASTTGGIGGTDSRGFAPSLAIGPDAQRFPFVAWLEQGISFPPQVFLRYFDVAGAAPSPTIIGFTPAKGPVGTPVTINGTNLDAASVTDVTFTGPVSAMPVTASATMITTLVPAGARSGSISVSGPGGLATSTSSFIVTPSITSVSPAAAGPGQTVTIQGFNLQTGSTAPVVKIGTVTAALTGATSATQVKAIVPLAAVTGLLSVTTADGTGTTATPFVVLQAPQIASMTPTSGPVGTLVQIKGKGLNGLPFISFRAFDPAAVFANVSTATEFPGGIEIDVVVPPGAISGPIGLVGLVGSVNSSFFSVTPGILDVVPAEVVAGSDSIVTVFGNNLFAGPNAPLPSVKVGSAVIPPASVFEPTPGPAPAPTATGLRATTPVRFRVPLGTPSGKVTITTSAGSGTSTATLNVIQPPKIVTFTPAMGPVGTVVTVTGTGLNGSTLVTFGGSVSTAPTQVTPTSLKVTVPDGALTGVLRVTNPAATGTSTGIFKVTPKITGFSPASVVAGGGTLVTITGSNLTALTGANTVKVGTFTIPPGLVLANSSTSIQFTVPLGAVTGKIGVTTVDGTGVSATDLVVIQPPKPAAFTPTGAPVGSIVTITGTNLAGAMLVTFGGNVSAPAMTVSAGSVKAVVPDGAITGKLSVTNDAGTGSTPGVFKVQPKIIEFAPSSVVAGTDTPVIVTGMNLRAATGTPVVKVGTFTIPPALVPTATASLVRFSVPLGAITGKVSITTIDGTATSAGNLVVQQPPRATGFVPAAAPVGALITVNGTNLTGVHTVIFSGGVFTSPVGVTPTAATMFKTIVPLGAITGPIGVVNAIGGGTSTAIFKVQPRITGFTPPSVVAGGGTPVTITGSNLQALTGTNTVKVGAFTIPPASVLANSPTSITFAVPLGAVTGKIGVTTVDGTGVSTADLLVIQPPKVTAFAPLLGPVGSVVTISGTNFTGITSVMFGGNVSTAPTTVSATMVKVTVPDGALTGPIRVTNDAGTATSAASFKVSPRITGFSPGSIPVGGSDVVTVTGVNLFAASGVPVVKVGAFTIPAASVLGNSSATTVQFLVPPGATTGKIGVTTIDGTGTSAGDLIVIQPPRVGGFTPAAAPVGAEVTVTGSNFAGVTDVLFSGEQLIIISGSVGGITPPFSFRIGGEIVSVTPTAVKVIVPSLAINGTIEVVNPAGSATSTQQFRVQPSIASFDPPSGSAGDSIVVMGFNLRSSGPNGPLTPLVKVNGVPAEVTAASATELTFKIPGLARTGPITVTTGDGTATSTTTLAITTPLVPDLVVSSVIVPAGAVRSTPEKPQTVSITTTVTNQGLAAAGPFSLAILFVPSDGTGPRVLGRRAFPTGLASGAVSTAPTTIPLPADVTPGFWDVRASVDYDETVAELFEDNNTSTASTPLQIFESVGGSRRFTVTLQPSSCLPIPFAVTIAGTGTITQTLDRFNLSGLTLTGSGLTISVSRLTGVLTPDGSVNVGSVTFSIQGVTDTLDLNGFVQDGVFDGFLFASDGHCPDLNVTVNFMPLPRLALSFDFFAAVGTFDADGLTALPAFPASISTWAPLFVAAYDGGIDALTFVGPSGSNFVRFPERIEPNAGRNLYRGRPVLPADGPAEPPPGTWQVAYKGAERAFVVAPTQSAVRLIVPVPSFTIDDLGVSRIDWTYRSATGASLATTPAFLRWISVTITDATGVPMYFSGGQLPDTRHIVPQFQFALDCAASVAFEYEDTLGNHYRLAYGRDVVSDACGIFGSASASTSVLTTETRSGATRRRTLTVQLDAQQGLVQSASVSGGPFSSTPLPFTGTRRLFDVVSDRFVIASDLPDGTPFPSGDTAFSVDAVFRGGGVPTTTLVLLDGPPSDGLLPFTGPSTTDQFDITTVRGVPTTFTWALDQVGFEVGQVALSARGLNSVGEACRAPDQPGLLTSDITEATLTIPATCFGRPIVSASVCLTAFGSGLGSNTTTCHVYDMPAAGTSDAGR